MFNHHSSSLCARHILVVLIIVSVSMFVSAPVCQAASDSNLTQLSIIAGPPDPFHMYKLSYNGKGLEGRGGRARLSLDIPGEPVKAFLYLVGRDSYKNGFQFPNGDRRIRVVTRYKDAAGNWIRNKVYRRVPVEYAIRGNSYGFINKLDITDGIREGQNRVTFRGYDLESPDGAVVLAVYKVDSIYDPDKNVYWYNEISFLEGADLGYHTNGPPLGPDTELATFDGLRDLTWMEAIEPVRKATIHMFIADCEGDRGDEIFLYTNTGRPEDWLTDYDRDGMPEIIRRSRRGGFLTLPDFGRRGNDPANESGRLEAVQGAVSLEEDKLGKSSSRFNYGPELDIFSRKYTVPPDFDFASFQIQSENPENGDSAILFLAINDVPKMYIPEIENPEIDIQKTVYKGHDEGASCPGDEVVQVAGSVGLVNTAEATGDPVDDGGVPIPDLTTVSDTDTAEVQATGFIPEPSLSVVVKANGETGDILPDGRAIVIVPNGDPITYSYEVTNNGNVELRDIEVYYTFYNTVGDPNPQSGLLGIIPSLAPGATETLYRYDTMDWCECNIATVKATLNFKEEVTYCFQVTNTGTTYLAGVNLTDADLGINRSYPGLLDPGGNIFDFEERTFSSLIIDEEKDSNEVCVIFYLQPE